MLHGIQCKSRRGERKVQNSPLVARKSNLLAKRVTLTCFHGVYHCIRTYSLILLCCAAPLLGVAACLSTFSSCQQSVAINQMSEPNPSSAVMDDGETKLI